MKVYMMNYGRPCGMRPVIYRERPANPCDEPGHECNPWCGQVEEFESELAARRFYKVHYPQLYEELVVINGDETN